MAFAHTYSIVARCPVTGELGVAVQSHWFAVGTLVPWIEAGVGAVATQSFVEPRFGVDGLAAMRDGASASDALDKLIAADGGRDVRQVGIVDGSGRAAAWTGSRCVAAAGHHIGDGFCVQANMMTSDRVWPAMAEAFERTSGDLVTRLLATLDAAESAGGDARGKQSAAVLVARSQSTGKPWVDRLFDLRVDDSADPLFELRRLVTLQRAYNHMNAGDLAMENKDITGALAAYSAAERLCPDSAEMVFWHSVALFNAGQTDEGRATLDRCYAMDARWQEMTPRIVAAGIFVNG
jgi:uncharacterized Ntn-hydrolase superfamily protein